MPLPLIRVGRWPRDEEFAVFPIGSKPKRMLTCPPDPGDGGLIPSHAYLFKSAAGWKAYQAWSEFIASEIAAILGLGVPKCFIAFDEKIGETGCLIEFFYGYPGEAITPRLVHGADLLNFIDKARIRDRPHSVRRNIRICRTLGVQNSPTWWAKVLTFDALIGNTDRHSENWGVLAKTLADGGLSVTMSPIYDNGTSLGYEVNEAKLSSMMDSGNLSSYINRGTTIVDGKTRMAVLYRIYLCVNVFLKTSPPRVRIWSRSCKSPICKSMRCLSIAPI